MISVSKKTSISPFRLHQQYRDFWGEPQPYAIAEIDSILESGCYRPRWYHAPDTIKEAVGIAPNGYLQYVLSIPAGSFILGWSHLSFNAMVVQITDVRLEHKFFSQPVPEWYFAQPGLGTDTLTKQLRALVKPYPVVPPGQFMVEFWNQSAVQNTRAQITLFVAELDPDAGSLP
jgi:hypothetical protein